VPNLEELGNKVGHFWVASFVSNTNPRERFVRLKLFMLIRVQKEVFVHNKRKGD
jgi:hypothetical protein